MIGVFVFFIVYLVFGLLNKKKNKDQRKLFYVCSSAIGLSFFLYFFEGQLTNYSFFSLGALFFLLNGCGLMRLLKLNKRYIYNHYYPFLTFSILYLFTDLIEKDSLGVDFLNEALIIAIIALSFVYASYGYWCLMQNLLYKTLRQFVVFYIAILYCTSILFFVVYLYPHRTFIYLDYLFHFNSLLLVIGATVYEIRLYVYFKNKTIHEESVDLVNKNKLNRLFDDVLLDVTIPSQQNMVPIGTKEFSQIPLPQLHQVDVIPEEVLQQKHQAIRKAIMTELIETRLFLDPCFNLDQLSSLICFSKADLVEFFKESASSTFKQYMNRLKVEYAILVIAENEENYTVEELSLLCGFNTRLSFYRAFMHVYGFPPSALLG